MKSQHSNPKSSSPLPPIIKINQLRRAAIITKVYIRQRNNCRKRRNNFEKKNYECSVFFKRGFIQAFQLNRSVQVDYHLKCVVQLLKKLYESFNLY